ncbi:ABC transporter permease [Aeromicrobium sp. CTD01-1L150]|uniref:ABC transporter permease n=1 Tax=Aeromicrobium sp. CTD01-1L150 TaxID=3341830 RepID=UPI0035BEE81D
MSEVRGGTAQEARSVPAVGGERDGASVPIRSRRENQALRAWAPSLALLLVVLTAWETAPRVLGVKSFIFPPLTEVLAKFTDPLTVQLYLSNALVTLQEALIGLAIGATLGIVSGFVLGQYLGVRRAFYPYIIALQSLPKVAVAPLFVIWFGFGLTPKVLVVVLITYFPVLVNTMSGVMGVDQSKIDLFRSLCASRIQTWRKLTFPSALPAIMAGLEVAGVMALLGAIVAEFVSAEAGLGLLLKQQQNNYDTAGVFAVLMILSLIGVVLNQTISFVRRRALSWSVSSTGGK